MSEQTDLFGLVDAPPMTPAERKRMQRRAGEIPRGHAAPPGTGPEGESCRTCAHLVRITRSKAWHKCAASRRIWTHSRRTDVRVSDPACSFWQAREEADG